MLARNEQLGSIKCAYFGCQSEDGRAYRDDCLHSRIVRGIDQRDVGAEGVTDEAEFVPICPRLTQGELHCARDIEWLHAAIRLLALALAHAAKVEAQRNEASGGEVARNLDEQPIIHRRCQRLWMAQHGDGSPSLAGGADGVAPGEHTLKQDLRLGAAGHGDTSLEYV